MPILRFSVLIHGNDGLCTKGFRKHGNIFQPVSSKTCKTNKSVLSGWCQKFVDFFFFFFCGMTRNISAAFLIFGKKFPKVSFLGFASKIRKYGNIPQPTSHISSGMCVAPLHTLTGPPPPQLQMLKIALGFYESATPSADHGHGAAVPIFALVLFEVVTTPNAILSFAALQLPGAAFQFWKTAENPRRDLHRKCVCTFGVAQAPMWSFGVKRDFFLIFVSSRFFLCVKISCFW